MKRVVLAGCMVLMWLWAAPAMTAGVMSAGHKDAGKKKSATCAACHSTDGNSKNPMWPKLAGQHQSYLYQQLKWFKSKKRVNAVMNGQAASLSDQDMKDLTAYFSAQTMSQGAASKKLVDKGRRLFRGGDKKAGVPACMSCHGPTGAGNPAAQYPRLAGQHAKYIATQLHAYRSGERKTPASKMMNDIASGMSDQQIQAVAQYVAGLHRASDRAKP